MTIKEIL
jgi:hypothetical protein